jgi:metal-responsive CopG/Arc/MetJ family transcriptional regulator
MTDNKMTSTRIDITLDTKVLEKLDSLIEEYGTNGNRSGMIASLIVNAYNKKWAGLK